MAPVWWEEDGGEDLSVLGSVASEGVWVEVGAATSGVDSIVGDAVAAADTVGVVGVCWAEAGLAAETGAAAVAADAAFTLAATACLALATPAVEVDHVNPPASCIVAVSK